MHEQWAVSRKSNFNNFYTFSGAGRMDRSRSRLKPAPQYRQWASQSANRIYMLNTEQVSGGRKSGNGWFMYTLYSSAHLNTTKFVINMYICKEM